MTAYAPEKPHQFWKLKNLLVGAPGRKKAGGWEQQFAAFSAWAASFKKG